MPHPQPTSGLSRAVLWDMDGTLADSTDQHWRAWRDAMTAVHRELTFAQFEAAFGQRNDRFLRSWLGVDLTDAEVARFGEDKEAAYRRLIEAEGLSPLPGADTWVRQLRADGWRQAVASSAPRANVEAMLRAVGLAGAFDAIVAAEDVTAGKPDPEVFLTAAARLGVPPRRCVVVEDAAVGIEAARRAGMRSVGVSRTPLPADRPIASLADLPNDAFDRLVAPGAGVPG